MSGTVVDGTQRYNRSKLWQIGFFTLNNTSTNIYLFALGFVTYYATGFVGLAVLLISSILSGVRLFDGLIDPIIGFIIDKTESRFGKFRPLIIIGNIILALSVILIYLTHLLPEEIRLIFLLSFLLINKIGYSLQASVTKAGQTVLTNDPKQRPLYAVFDGIYNVFIFTGGQIFVSSYLMGKYNQEFSLELFAELNLYAMALSGLFAILAVIGIWDKDHKDNFGLGEDTTETKLRDYWKVIKGNKPLLMLTISASTDKLATSLFGHSVVVVMLFGILLGDYALSGTISLVTIIPTILITILVTAYARKTGLKRAYVTSVLIGIVSLVGLIALFLLLDDPSVISLSNIGIITIVFLILHILSRAFGSIPTTLVVPMIADVSDYETAKSGRYIPGMMGTIFSFIDQLVSSLAPLIVGVVVAMIGYGSEFPQVGEALTTPLLLATLVLAFGLPALGLTISLIMMKFYKLDKKTMEEIQTTIAKAKGKSKVTNETAV